MLLCRVIGEGVEMIIEIRPNPLNNARSASVYRNGEYLFSGGHSSICHAFNKDFKDSRMDPFRVRVSKELFEDVMSRVGPSRELDEKWEKK